MDRASVLITTTSSASPAVVCGGLLGELYDPDASGRIDASEFLRLAERRPERRAGGGGGDGDGGGGGGGKIALISEQVAERLGEWVTQQKAGGIHRVFRKLDKDGSGSIEASEFKKCLKKMKLELDADEMTLLMEVHSRWQCGA